ncbi:MAG: BatD family protein, partial [Bacteroidales bacterium]
KFILSKNRVVVGEPLTLSIKLYTKVPISGFEDVKFPSFDTFWAQELHSPKNLEFARENVGGEIYDATLLRSYTLIPQQSGSISIDGAEIVCQVRVKDASRGGRSLFDDFFDSYQNVRKRVVAPIAKVVVEPLPSGAPPSFSGGVGNFTISSKLSKDSVAVNEALYLTVEIKGSGNLNLLELPNPSIPSSFESYDPKVADSKSGGVLSSKKFEYPLIARAPGEYNFEAIEFSYWDIGEKRYKILKTSPLYLKVSNLKVADTTSEGGLLFGANKQSVKSIGEDIKFIVTKANNRKSSNLFFLYSPLYIATAVLLLSLGLLLNALMSRKIKRERDVALMRNRKARKVAKQRLLLAERELKSNHYSLFYQSLYSALLGYISDKLNLNISEISKEKIVEELDSRGVTKEMADKLIYLLNQCEYARYAPNREEGEMEAHYSKAAELIFSMEL